MIAIERVYRAAFLSEQQRQLEGAVSVIAEGLTNKDARELELLDRAGIHMARAAALLSQASLEARRGCEVQILNAQLEGSIAQIASDRAKCAEVGQT